MTSYPRSSTSYQRSTAAAPAPRLRRWFAAELSSGDEAKVRRTAAQRLRRLDTTKNGCRQCKLTVGGDIRKRAVEGHNRAAGCTADPTWKKRATPALCSPDASALSSSSAPHLHCGLAIRSACSNEPEVRVCSGLS